LAQCCFDTVAWMWKSYRKLHEAWRRDVAVARRDGAKFWLAKLLRREPQEPFINGTSGKVPIWFDGRIGSIERSSHLKLCPYVARVSTLRRGVKLTVPLNPGKYHLDLLEQGTPKSFQLVKRNRKYYVHEGGVRGSNSARLHGSRNRSWSETVNRIRDAQARSTSKVKRLFNSTGWVEAGSTEPSGAAHSRTPRGAEVGASETDTTQTTAHQRIL
jgi:hypothetical protein